MAEETHMDLVLKDIFKFSRIIGTFPFDNSFKITKRTMTRSVSLLVFFSVCSSIDLYHFQFRRIIKLAFTAFTNLLAFLALISNRKYVLLMYKSLLKVEMDMLNDGTSYKWRPGHMRLYLIQYLYTLVILVSSFVPFHPSQVYHTLFMALSYMFTFLLTLSVITQFTTLQCLLSSLFCELTEPKNINRTLIILTNLRSASGALNSIYGLQILFYTTTIFACILCNIYFDLSCNQTTELKIKLRVWIVVIFCSLVVIIVSSRRTVAQARKVDEKLHEKMLEDITSSHNQNELLEFHLTCGTELEFNACGFFRLDNSLICSMIACATTYMVILMQFTNPVLACGASSIHNNSSVSNNNSTA